MQYRTPSDIPDLDRLKREAARRRQALVKDGCSTYAIGTRAGSVAIQCLCCGLGSFDQRDIKNKFCGFCQAIHSEWRESPLDG